MTILKSASRLVLIVVAITICIALVAIVFSNLTSEPVSMAVIAISSSAIGSVFTYYFTKATPNTKE
jgi:membrane protein YqaA with SNARE-associated domain